MTIQGQRPFGSLTANNLGPQMQSPPTRAGWVAVPARAIRWGVRV